MRLLPTRTRVPVEASPREPRRSRRQSGLSLFLRYALLSALAVAGLGLVLVQQARQNARLDARRQVHAQADAIASAAIEPALAGHSLDQPLGIRERGLVRDAVDNVIASGTALRVRLRSSDGAIVFSDDGTMGKLAGPVPADVGEALAGITHSEVTTLNSDGVDRARGLALGPPVAEVYRPLHARAAPRTVIGVLELYVPYAPIAAAVDASLLTLYRQLVVGLSLLWLVLAGIALSVSRRIRRHAAEQVHLALHDPLTDLPNRALFRDRAAQAIALAARSKADVAFVVIDLDRFKQINDTLGQGGGDRFLRELARNLEGVLRDGDTAARLGGDEFGLVLPGIDRESALPILERVRAACATEIEVDGLPISAEASIGAAFWPLDGTEIEGLLQAAATAMQAGKETHGGIALAEAVASDAPSGDLMLLSELRRAMERDELVLHYQPRVDAKTGAISSVEALVRWQHPQRGLLAPLAFVPSAEATELIVPLTRWVLQRAISQLSAWSDSYPQLSVSINISARNLRDGSLPEQVVEILEQFAVDASRVCLELTETALVSDPSAAEAVLTRLAETGVGISLDDFGRGYTSLSYLGRLPLDELKIDRSFVAGILEHSENDAIVRSVVALGHQLGLRVVAEGVETTEVAQALVTMGCDVLQGYLVSRPIPAAELEAWMANLLSAAR